MPQDTQNIPAAPKLDPGFDYAELPDHSYAQFKKGTSPEQMKAMLTAKGLLKPTSGKYPTGSGSGDPNTDTAMLSQVRRPARPTIPTAYGFTPGNMAKNVYETTNAMGRFGYGLAKDLLGGPEGMRQAINKNLIDPAVEQARKAKEDYNNKRLIEAAGHGLAAALPGLGPVASGIGEQMGTGDIGGGLTSAATMYLLPKATSELLNDYFTPENHRRIADELNTKVLKQADPKVKGYTKLAGLQVAKEGIVSSARQLPAKIEAARMAKNTEVIRQAQATSGTIDVDADIKPIAAEVARVANTRGLLTDPVKTQLVNFLQQRIMTMTDMQTGATIPRPLNKLTVMQAIELEKGLGDLSGFGKDVPTAVENLAKRVRQAINDKLPPDIQRLRAEESRLITARESSRATLANILNDNHRMMKGLIYSGAGPIAVYMGIKALGGGFMTAIGSVVILRALAQSTPSRTLRAALHSKIADWLESSQQANAAPTSPVQPRQPQGGPLVPQSPQPAQNRALTTQNPPPFASATFTTNPAAPQAAPPRGTELPATATRARAGSGDYVRGTKESTAKPAPTSVAVSNIKLAADLGKDKAMMDRLDTLLERQASPKSAMDRAAITKEIDEVKRLLKGESVPGAAKRIADRERLADKRAQAAQQATPQKTGADGEAVSQAASPELRAIALDAGYKKLATYEGGPEMVKALQSTAKALQKVDPTYDEVEKLTEALQVLKELEGQ